MDVSPEYSIHLLLEKQFCIDNRLLVDYLCKKNDFIMQLEKKLKVFGGVPLTHSSLLSILGEYRSPNDKIVRMIDYGLLLPVKKGLYAVSTEITGIPLHCRWWLIL